jgi:hypothetical protein
MQTRHSLFSLLGSLCFSNLERLVTNSSKQPIARPTSSTSWTDPTHPTVHQFAHRDRWGNWRLQSPVRRDIKVVIRLRLPETHAAGCFLTEMALAGAPPHTHQNNLPVPLDDGQAAKKPRGPGMFRVQRISSLKETSVDSVAF